MSRKRMSEDSIISMIDTVDMEATDDEVAGIFADVETPVDIPDISSIIVSPFTEE